MRIFGDNMKGKFDVEDVYKKLVKGLKSFFNNAGFSKAVIGLSGGIDSSVVCVLAVEALGKENVIGVSMPSKYSDDASHTLAKELADNLGIKLLYAPIDRSYNTVSDQLVSANAIDRGMSVTKENIQSRLRMIFLMAIANENNALLLDTGNSTENGLGYATLYGDLAGAVAPVGELNKMQVYAVGIHYNMLKDSLVIPKYVFERKPSAELSEGQTDPFDYEIYSTLVDELMTASEGRDKVRERMISEGYPEECIDDAMERMERNSFKWHYAPPNIKI